jgi:broad specificity phosphatase PhoE
MSFVCCCFGKSLTSDLGPYDSDIDPGEGIDHAVSIAQRIASGVDGVNATATANDSSVSENNADSVPAVVYASPFLRTAHTGYIVANELQKKHQVELRLEEGLWEWLIPSLLVTKVDGIKTNPRPLEILKEDLVKLEENRSAPSATATIAIEFQSVNPYDDSGDVSAGIVCVPEREKKTAGGGGGGKPPTWTESEQDLLARCDTTLSRLLDLHQTDAKSICIVSHAPCDQAMAFYLEKQSANAIETPKDSKLTPWPLGGITVFSRPVLYGDDEGEDGSDQQPTGFGDWTMELYGNTEHMPGDYKAGLKEWSLPCFSK